jgi:uncharacterized membrane protein
MNKDKTLHNLFVISIVIKGIDGFLELVGGIILLAIKSGSLTTIVHTIFQHELVQDPTDLLANYLINASQHLSISAISFASVYLIIHGIIKLGIVFAISFKQLWAYLSAGIILFFFIIYQLIRILKSHSLILLFLTLIDILIIILLRFEYKKVKNKKPNFN